MCLAGWWRKCWAETWRNSTAMPERVYIETTFISYLTARPNRDIVIAGHQQTTHEWWDKRRTSYEPPLGHGLRTVPPSPTAGLPRSVETSGQRTGTVRRPGQNREQSTPEELSEIEPCPTPLSMKCGACATNTPLDSIPIWTRSFETSKSRRRRADASSSAFRRD